MKKPGTDKSAGKKKPASPKPKGLDDKRIEKYKKQSLNPEDEDEDFDELPAEDELDIQVDDFDDFDDEDDEDY